MSWPTITNGQAPPRLPDLARVTDVLGDETRSAWQRYEATSAHLRDLAAEVRRLVQVERPAAEAEDAADVSDQRMS